MQRTLLDDHFKALAGQSESRQSECWYWGCTKSPVVWIKEVQFGIKGEVDSHFISSKDTPGPVPGFCLKHQISGPAELAQTIYRSSVEMQWGFRPKYWYCVFTDGTMTGGECLSLTDK